MNPRRPVPCNRRPCSMRPAGAAPPAWDPTAIAGHAWSLVADPACQWQDTAQTTPATAATDPIRRWRTRYGTDLAFDAPSDSARPLVTSTGLGGGRGAIFDGGNDDCRATWAGIDGAQWWGFYFANNAAFVRFLALVRSATSKYSFTRIQSATSIIVGAGLTGSGGAGITVPSMGTTAHTLVWTWDGATTYEAWWDGASATVGAGSSGIAGVASTAYVGSFAGSLYFNGTVGKVSTGSGTLTAGERASLIAWLGTP